MNYPKLQGVVSAPRSRREVEFEVLLNTFAIPIHHWCSPFVVQRCLLP